MRQDQAIATSAPVPTFLRAGYVIPIVLWALFSVLGFVDITHLLGLPFAIAFVLISPVSLSFALVLRRSRTRRQARAMGATGTDRHDRRRVGYVEVARQARKGFDARRP